MTKKRNAPRDDEGRKTHHSPSHYPSLPFIRKTHPALHHCERSVAIQSKTTSLFNMAYHLWITTSLSLLVMTKGGKFLIKHNALTCHFATYSPRPSLRADRRGNPVYPSPRHCEHSVAIQSKTTSLFFTTNNKPNYIPSLPLNILFKNPPLVLFFLS